ncbi:MAG: peptide chain release factor N(5)-glutamine methyltransferase [Candidatus Omnitrophica bacterium]|nr:peptide chain release factor N(5)-glutamine methyltransferase [Candidatus Omnitrophota bacterium]
MNNTVTELISRFDKHDISSSRVNAEVMLSHILGCRIIDLYTKDMKLTKEHIDCLENMVIRRVHGEPLQYITGKVHFYGNELFIKEGVFIPRPETEILVDVVIGLLIQHSMQDAKSLPLIYDLCTGSGNIAISLTKALSRCKIISSDISDDALYTAKKNSRLNGVYDRIKFIKSDLFDIPGSYRNRFDIIVVNPPYISSDEIEHLSSEVRREPEKALDGGKDGLEFYNHILKKAPSFLKKNGFIALELPDGKDKELRELIAFHSDFKDIRIFKDLNNIGRVITAQKDG